MLQPPVKIPRKPRRSTRLRALPPEWRPTAGVPATRAECPTERPCPYIRCEWNAWIVDGRDRGGRWGNTASTVQVTTERNCGRDALDRAVEQGKTVPPAAIAELYGLSERAVRAIVERAKAKLAAALPPELPAVELLLEELGR